MTVPFVSQPNTMEMETISSGPMLLEPNTVTIPHVQLENMSSL